MSDSKAEAGTKQSGFALIFRSRTFIALSAIFLALVGLIGTGLFYTSTEFHTSLKPGGGLLDGLIANGISVVISVILISPLTAYFISLRREQQLAPVRRSFVESLASEIDRLAKVYIHQGAIYGNAVVVLETGLFGNAIGHNLETFNEWLSSITAKNIEIMNGKTTEGLDKSREFEEHAILHKTLKEASLVRDMTMELYQTFYRETVSLENTVLLAMPIFPAESTKALHDIRSMLIDYRGSLQDMLAVLGGDDSAVVSARARNSILDFGKLITNIQVLADSSQLGQTINEKMKAADSMDKEIGLRYQRDIAVKLVEIFEQARKFDHDADRLRRGGRPD